MGRVVVSVIVSCFLLVAGVAFTIIKVRRYRRSRDPSQLVLTVASAVISVFSAASLIADVVHFVGRS